MRNVLIAAGNSGDATLVPLIEALLRDGSPLVRAMAVWALSRLLAEPDFARLRNQHMTHGGGRGRAPRMGDGMNHLLCFGLGFSARVLAARLAARGWTVSATSRSGGGAEG